MLHLGSNPDASAQTTTGQNLGTQGLTWHNTLDVPFFGGPPLEDPRQAAEFIVHLFLKGLGIPDSSLYTGKDEL